MIPLLRAAKELGRALAAVWRDPDTKALPVVAGALVLTGTLFYWRFEDWTIIEALYFCVVTLTTVGFGDLSPTTAETQIFTIVYILTGFGVLVALLTSVAEQYLALKAEGGGGATTHTGPSKPRPTDGGRTSVEPAEWSVRPGNANGVADSPLGLLREPHRAPVGDTAAVERAPRPREPTDDPLARPQGASRWAAATRRRLSHRRRVAGRGVIFGIVEHLLDRETFPTVWLGMWWHSRP